MKFTNSIALAACLAVGVGTGATAQDEGANYILATASTGGTYYPVGVAIATLTKVKLEPKQKIGMAAISSAGSGENVPLGHWKKLARKKTCALSPCYGKMSNILSSHLMLPVTVPLAHCLT